MFYEQWWAHKSKVPTKFVSKIVFWFFLRIEKCSLACQFQIFYYFIRNYSKLFLHFLPERGAFEIKLNFSKTIPFWQKLLQILLSVDWTNINHFFSFVQLRLPQNSTLMTQKQIPLPQTEVAIIVYTLD